jgi:hypothetical protein
VREVSVYDALWQETASEEEVRECYQQLVNTGDAWRFEGHVGRNAMAMIDDGIIVLGEVGHRDFYGNYVPSRTEVQPGTKGSVEYARERHPELWGAE